MSKKSIEKEHRHRAPEIVLGQTPSFASDMCSLGVHMADASSKINMESYFKEGQRECLQRDPKFICSTDFISSFTAQSKCVNLPAITRK